MLIKPLLRSLSPFLLLFVHAPFAASITCYWLSNLNRHTGTFRYFGDHYRVPSRRHCQHIISALPESLQLSVPSTIANGKLTLGYGPLRTHRYDLPAVFKHRTCEIYIHTLMGDPVNGPEANRTQAAFYIWNVAKSISQEILDQCLRDPRRSFGGLEHRSGSAMGLTEPSLQGSRIVISLSSVGMCTFPEGEVNYYDV